MQTCFIKRTRKRESAGKPISPPDRTANRTRKADCTLTALNFELEPVGQVEGLLTLFEHEFDGFTFWHAMAINDEGDQIASWFEYGQTEDLKIRVDLETGETGRSKLVYFRVDKNPPFEMAQVGLTGLNPLKPIQQE